MSNYKVPKYRCKLVRDGKALATAPKVQCFEHAVELLFQLLADLPHEEMWVLYLNGTSTIVGAERVSQGGMHGTAATAREVFRGAIVGGASAIIVSHNHPSGDASASADDITTTRALVAAGETIGIPVLDHIVVCPESKTATSIIQQVSL